MKLNILLVYIIIRPVSFKGEKKYFVLNAFSRISIGRCKKMGHTVVDSNVNNKQTNVLYSSL